MDGLENCLESDKSLVSRGRLNVDNVGCWIQGDGLGDSIVFPMHHHLAVVGGKPCPFGAPSIVLGALTQMLSTGRGWSKVQIRDQERVFVPHIVLDGPL